MNNRKRAVVAVAAVAAVIGMAVSVQAAWVSRINHLTFSGPVALPGVALASGTYTFELAPPSGGLDVVRVTSRDGRRVFFQGFTNAVLRPGGLGKDDVVTFGEAPAGQAAPIDTWYPVGSPTGHRFIYR
jgi:hypothetical protein